MSNYSFTFKEMKVVKKQNHVHYVYIERNIGTFPIIAAQAIKSPIMKHTFMVTFCFHIEFHRKATVINCCELKKKWNY